MIEYQVIQPLPLAKDLEAKLNEMGKEDWCLVYVGVVWVFLRVVNDDQRNDANHN